MIQADNTQSWLDQHNASDSFIGQGISSLVEKRNQGIQQFEATGLPGVRDEDWRYTNIRALKSNAYELSTGLPNDLSNIVLPASNNARLVFVNGYFAESLSNTAGLAEGITFTSMANALETHGEILADKLGTSLPEDQHGFTTLNTAFFNDGYALLLAPNTVSKDPIEVLFVTDNASSENGAAVMRNIVIAGANSQCTIVERFVGTDGQVYLNNSLSEVFASDNAHLDHYKIQQESDAAFHVGGVFIKQDKHAQISNHNLSLGGLLTRNDIHSTLLGEGGHVEMNGLVLGVGRQLVDNHTQVNHLVPNCTSDEYYKTILDDHSRSIFRGRIIVAQDAQLTNADQQNNNLLLSKHAEADCKPQLEIYADDVKCSHGATVGQLDPASLFYLRSRGIDQASANGLLTFAFANEVIERIKVDSIRQEMTEILAGQLLSGLEDLV